MNESTLSVLHCIFLAFLDRIQLDVVRQFLFSQFLALRIRAMSLLQDIIERVSAPRATSTHGNIFSLSVSRHASPAPGLEMSTWLTADYFLDWLVTSEVLLVMLGEEEALKKYGVADNHMEILRRSEPVLLFLIDRHKLSPPILSLVCNMCNRKFNSEGRVKVGYRLLTSLIGKLDQSQLRQVFETVAGVTNEPEEAHIELLKTMARTALELNCSEEDFGLQALWRISQGGASPQPVRKMAAFALAELLASKAAETPLRFILLNIVTVLNGDDHAQSRHACALMRSILSAQSLSSTQPSGAAATKKDACRDSTILLAESSFHFLAVLLDELKRAVVANVGQEELIPRLNFVRYILENSVLQLTYDRLESLWSVFNDSKAPHLTELFLKWLTELVPWEQHIYRINICISADTADAFFESHIRCEPSSLRYSSLGIEGYECVELMFRFINGREKTMSFAMAKDYFVVEEDRLIGLSVLFRAIREPTSDLVSQRATQFIVSLQTHLNPRLDKYMYWTSFVTKCMTMVLRYVDLYDTHGEYPVERIDNVIYRLLNILVQLISAIRRPMTSPSAEPVSPNDVKVSVYLKCPNSSASSSKSGFVYIFKRKGLTIGSIRSRLSCDLNHDTKLVQMRLTHQNKALSLADDHSTSLEHVMSPVFFEATLLTESNELEEEDVCDSYNAARPGRTSDDDPDSDQMRLRIFLSSHPAYFSCFFRLLSSSNSKITGLVWKLLESLPVNVHMKDAFMCFHARSDSASAVNWSEVLSISQPMHLLYRLRVILQLLSCVNDPFAVVEERESARNWYHYFVRAEGMKHIANLFVSTNVVSLTEPFVLQHELLFLMLNILTEALMLSEPIRDREKGVVEGTILIEGSTDAGGVNSDFDSYMDAVIATPMADGGNDLVDEIFDDAEDVYFHSIDVTVAATTAIRTTSLSSSGDGFECGSPKDPSMYTTSEDRSASDRNWDSRVSWIMVAEKMVSLIHAVSVLASEQEKGFQKGTVSISLGLDSLSPPPPFALQDIRDESSCGRGIMRIMETGVALLVAITTRDPLLFSSLLSLPTLQPALIFSLLQSPVMSRMVSRGIWKLCTTADVSPAPFVRLLLPAFAQTADFEHSCNEFFKLIIDLVALPGALEDIEVSDILLKLNRAIVERPNVELSEEDDDFPLQGYMSLILGILAALPSIDRSQVIALTLEHVDLVHELLTNCLFPISASPQNQSIFSEHEFFIPKPKCLSPTSRTLAFSLLTELANSSHTVYNRTLNFVSQLYSLRDFDTTGLRRLRSSSDHGTRTKTGYCGLRMRYSAHFLHQFL